MGIVFSGMFAFGLVLFSRIDTDQHLGRYSAAHRGRSTTTSETEANPADRRLHPGSGVA